MSDKWFHIPPDLQIGPSSSVLPMAGEANWGVSKFAVQKLRDVVKGRDLIVAVLDTGVDRAHPILSSVFASKDFTGSPVGPADRNQHGTHCMGTVLGSDPNIGMYDRGKGVMGKCLSDAGSGSDTWIAAAGRWAVEEMGARVVSMSLGSSSASPTINGMMQEMSEKYNAWFICAAGNSGGNTSDIDWPGRSPWCVSVAALNKDLTPASFSSAGVSIKTSYAGVDIWSAKPGGTYQQMSGTSMATPGVAGISALYRQGLIERGMTVPTVQEYYQLLTSDSVDVHTGGTDRRTGPGFISPVLLALNLEALPPLAA